MPSRQTTWVEVGLTKEQIIIAIKRMKKKERQDFIEDLLAATSPEYLSSIREARADKNAGRVKNLQEVFGR